ncbi:MAG: ATPase, P-type (transporting), superfamily, subfamily IC/heavy metal translocating P-type ATPase [Herbinix sp.]|nr:ATPase, P-type (transporting), superfamily, subfamily IC/heavy metal translocating P-type ATPase [Herbinix sp.]
MKGESLKFTIKHEIEGRMRIHLHQEMMSYQDANTLFYYLRIMKTVTSVKVYDRTADASIEYLGDRASIITALLNFNYGKVEVPEIINETSGRELNAIYQEKLIIKSILRYAGKLYVPFPIRAVYTWLKGMRYVYKGLQCLVRGKLEVPVLDAVAIGVSLLRNDPDTASSIMYLLGVGELLEEWTHKKSVDDLARSMTLNIGKVWLQREDQEVLVPTSEIKTGDIVLVHMGNVIPFDGIVAHGEAMINQASLTGESVPVKKNTGRYVYAGTVIEEGELAIEVKEISGSTRFEKIVTMIEESEKLKSSVEGKAEHLADRLVPYTLLGAGLTYLLTGNMMKALSVLLVDFSCALKLAMPISVLSAIREASIYNIQVKGGKYLEAVADATTIVFDKTGTLTKATPTVAKVISFCEKEPEELLRIAACLEEHFPHSMAKAVVRAASEKNLEHEEMHSKVDYIVAHGISSFIDSKKVLIGSYHFIFEDESCTMKPEYQEQFDQLPSEYSLLYLSIENELAAVICIEDPLREEAEAVINSIRKLGIKVLQSVMEPPLPERLRILQ